MKSRAGSAYISCSGQSGSTTAAADRIRREHVGEDAHEGLGRGVGGLLIQRRHRQRVPQPLLQRGPLGVAIEPLLHGQARRVHGHRLRRLQLPPRRLNGPAEAQRVQPVPPRDRLPCEHAGEQVQRRRQRRAAQHRPLPVAVVAHQLERVLRAHAIRGAAPGAGMPASPDNSRRARAGRCPRARRCGGRGTPWRARQAAAGHRRPGPARRAPRARSPR